MVIVTARMVRGEPRSTTTVSPPRCGPLSHRVVEFPSSARAIRSLLTFAESE